MVAVLKWIKEFLSPRIIEAIEGTVYPEDQLAAMAYRETGWKIEKYLNQKLKYEIICELMKGDYGQRPWETEKQYHGFGFWQIDIGSYPEFVKSGDWKDPLKTCIKAVDVLESKRTYITTKMPGLAGDALERAITASYNCGEGNVFKALINHKDVDFYTFNHDYSKAVWDFREMYKDLK